MDLKKLIQRYSIQNIKPLNEAESGTVCDCNNKKDSNCFQDSLKIDSHDYWDPKRFSDPLCHDENKYMYIVHAVTDNNDFSGAITAQMATSLIANGQGTAVNVDLINHPTDIYKKPVISCSVVSEKKHATWKNAGLILRVPKENIVYASNSDLGTNMTDKEGTIKRFSSNELLSPEDILKNANEHGYTEVVILGETEFGKVEPVRCIL